MQLSRARNPLDSFYVDSGPSTPHLLDQDPPSTDLLGFAMPIKDPLYPSLSHLSSAAAISDPSSSSSGSFAFGADGSPSPPDTTTHNSYSSILNFRYGCGNPILASSSILSFDQSSSPSMSIPQFEDYAAFADAFEHADYNGLKSSGAFAVSGFESGSRSVACGSREGDRDEQFGWIYSDNSATVKHGIQRSDHHGLEGPSNKRPYLGGEVQPSKKHSGGTQKKPKTTKPSSASKDPQSIAAKNRRERISERLKILQDLVPNGTKVDLVTMLEKAISYVKFLQLQVKVLSTDELWPSQGGKAPEIGQVREVIDSILSSHRERTSCTK